MAFHIYYPSPVGMLTLVARDEAITAVVIDGQKYADKHLADAGSEQETTILTQTKWWLDRYFAQKQPAVSELPLSPDGTPFQKQVWRELLQIPYGKTVTYGELAERLHTSARAVGGAVGKNPISILIPCHRVVGSGGALTGYAGGLTKKKALLSHEEF